VFIEEEEDIVRYRFIILGLFFPRVATDLDRPT
jgi:hypothetical protein